MIRIKQKGDFRKTERFLDKLKRKGYLESLRKWGDEGVEALSIATPKDTGFTASMWRFEIEVTGTKARIVWRNDNINKDEVIAILIQYGHGTRNGGYVQGVDYINPAIKPIFDKIAKEAWEGVVSI